MWTRCSSKSRRDAKRLDVLVNNAAHLGVGPGPLETELEFFEAVVRVNLVGTFHVSQQAALLMRPQGGDREHRLERVHPRDATRPPISPARAASTP